MGVRVSVYSNPLRVYRRCVPFLFVTVWLPTRVGGICYWVCLDVWPKIYVHKMYTYACSMNTYLYHYMMMNQLVYTVQGQVLVSTTTYMYIQSTYPGNLDDNIRRFANLYLPLVYDAVDTRVSDDLDSDD